MKAKEIRKKLVINKETIACLKNLESVKGGALTITCMYPLSRCICDTWECDYTWNC